MDFKYYISKIDRPTDDSIILELSDKLGRPVFDFRPGQYVMLAYRNERGIITDKHAFSLASSPTTRDHIQLGIKIHGNFTQGLAKLQAGDVVFVSGPFGSFTFNEKKHHDLVMIAGGIGITPFLSTIRYATDKHLPNRISLLYSNRTLEGTLFFDEIKTMEERNRNFRNLFCVSSPKIKINQQDVVYQRIDTRLLGDYLGPLTQKTFFICGPLSFMSGMKENLFSLGVDKEQIEMEEFSMIPAAGFWTGVKNISYAVSLSGLLIIAPLGLIYNSSVSASGGKLSESSILSPNYYNSEKFYRLARTTYDQLLAEKQNGALAAEPQLAQDDYLPIPPGGLPVAAEIATDSASSTLDAVNPAKELVKAIVRVFNKDLPPLKKLAAAENPKKPAPVAPPLTKAAPAINTQVAPAVNKAAPAPAPTTHVSGAPTAAAPAANAVTTPANTAATAPTPTTSASGSVSAPAPTAAAPAASTPGQTATVPTPTTSASAPAGNAATVTTPTASQPATSQTTTSRNRHYEQEDD